jgi:CheY-like chemotaxis protein
VSRRVLLVDDDAAARRLLGDLLAVSGYAVQTAGSGEEALAALAEPPDVVLLDARLPDADGVALCGQIRQDPAIRHVPVVMTTGLSDPADRRRAEAAGVDHYLVKPLDLQSLLELLERL